MGTKTSIKWEEAIDSGISLEGVPLKAIPRDHLIGRPFRTFATGKIFCRHTGEIIGKEEGWSLADLQEMVDFFNSGAQEDCPINLEHDEFIRVGEVLGMAIVPLDGKPEVGADEQGQEQEKGAHPQNPSLSATQDYSLVVIPAYNVDGIKILDMTKKNKMYSSPEIIYGTTFDARTGETLSKNIFSAVALTLFPAQSKNILNVVELSDKENKMNKKKFIKLSDEKPVEEEKKKEEEESLEEAPCECPEGEECDCPEQEQPSEESPEEEAPSEDLEEEPLPEEESSEESEAPSEESSEEPSSDEEESPEEEDKEEEKMSKLSSKANLSAIIKSQEKVILSMKRENESLKKELLSAKKKLFSQECKRAIDELIASGAITPAERETAERAYRAEYSAANPENLIFRPFSEMFLSRQSGEKVSYKNSSHGSNLNREDKLDVEIKKFSKEKNVPYHVALSEVLKSKKNK